MIKVKSNLEKAEELAELISDKTPYKAHVAYFNALCFAQGNTLTIKKSFLNSIQIVYDCGDINYYTRSEDLTELESEILKRIEKITNKQIVLRNTAEITFGGR